VADEDEDEPKDARHELEHPFETVHDIVEEVEQGRSPWTPFIALESVSVVIAIVVVIVLGLAFLAYYLAA
jgi:hypothetical protein